MFTHFDAGAAADRMTNQLSAPPLPYGRQWIEEDDIQLVSAALRSDWLTTGPFVDRFEAQLAEAVGARYAVAVANGTAALHLACLAAGVVAGDVLVTTPITFAASANCALYCGADVAFVDIDPETRNLSTRELGAFLQQVGGGASEESRVKVVLPVHYGGLPCDMEVIARAASGTANENNVVIIEDACHALGAEYQAASGEWVRVGSCRHSHMTVFSFHPVKHIATGEGGAITTNDRELYQRLRKLRSHGITREASDIGPDAPGWYYEQQELGYNYRLTDIQAALGCSQLTKLGRFVARRRELAASYKDALGDLATLLQVPPEPQGFRSAYHLFPIALNLGALTGGRQAVYDALRARGIGVQVHYIPVHLQPYYRNRYGFELGDFPHAEAYYEATVSLPMYPRLADADIDRVVSELREILTQRKA